MATDTQKNTIYAFARDGVGSPEAFLLRLGEHFTSSFDWVTGGRWEAESYRWDRIQAHGSEHDHSFVRNGQEVRTAVLVRDGAATHLISGLKDLTVLKSTQSGFVGYPKDKYTTLPETTDRILATDVSARWRFKAGTDFSSLDFNKNYEDVKALLLEGFTEKYSHALQQTLFDMGTKVLEAHSEIDEIKFSHAQQAPLPGGPLAVRPRQPQRGLLRRRPPVRPDRGHRPARRRRPGGHRLVRHRRFLLISPGARAREVR